MALVAISPGGASVGGSATTSASAATAIPTLSDGRNPNWLYVSGAQGAAVSWLFNFGDSSVADPVATGASISGIAVSNCASGIIVNVSGCTHYKVESTAADTDYTLTPLAGFG